MAGDQPAIAPDQLKKGHPKAFRIAAVLTIIVLLVMLIPNQEGNIASIWLIGTAAGIAAFLVADVVMRRRGLKR